MNLTEEEKVMVYKLREYKRSWEWRKWVLLVAGALLFTSSVIRLLCFQRRPSDVELLMYTWSATLGGVAARIAIRNWNGMPQVTLLLKLLDNATEKEQDITKRSAP